MKAKTETPPLGGGGSDKAVAGTGTGQAQGSSATDSEAHAAVIGPEPQAVISEPQVTSVKAPLATTGTGSAEPDSDAVAAGDGEAAPSLSASAASVLSVEADDDGVLKSKTKTKPKTTATGDDDAKDRDDDDAKDQDDDDVDETASRLSRLALVPAPKTQEPPPFSARCFRIGSEYHGYVYTETLMMDPWHHASVFKCVRDVNLHRRDHALFLYKSGAGHWVAVSAAANSDDPILDGQPVFRTLEVADPTVSGWHRWRQWDTVSSTWQWDMRFETKALDDSA